MTNEDLAADLATLRGSIDAGFQCSVPDCPACRRKDERLSALARVEAELSRLRERCARLVDENANLVISANVAVAQSERDAARCARLQQALQGEDLIYAVINEVTSRWEDSGAARGRLVDREGCVQAIRYRLREALAGPDTPADNLPPGNLRTYEPPPITVCPNCGRHIITAECEACAMPADSQEDKT